MRRTTRCLRRLATCVIAVGMLAAIAPPGARVAVPPMRLTDSYSQQIAQLQQQYDALGTQLQGLQGSEATASAQAAAVQQQFAATQSQVQETQAQIDRLNLELAQTAEAIQVDTNRLAGEKAQLTKVMVVIYTAGGTSVVSGLVQSQSIAEFMEQLGSATTVSQRFRQLIAQVQADQRRLTLLEQTQQVNLTQAAAAENRLEALEATLQGQPAELRAEAASLGSQAASLVNQRQSLLSQIASVKAQQQAAEEAAAAAAAAAAAGHGGGGACGDVLCPFAFGDIPDSFPWGQCTWYVASLREVTWWGNADAWFDNAQGQGYSTGQTPKVGAVVVWGSGNGYSYYGHVAYVVAVDGPSDFYVDEANYSEVPGQLDMRQVTTLSDIEGFIY